MNDISKFDGYQKESKKTVMDPKRDNNVVYLTLGILGEAGEIADKVKKVIRDNRGVFDNAKKEDLKGEIGDVLWYLAQISTELGFRLSDAAKHNIDKTQSRMKRGKLSGSGDKR